MEKQKISFNLETAKLLHDNLLLRIVDVRQKSDYLVNPRQYNDKPEIGLVIGAGPRASIAVGEAVLFSKYLSTQVTNPSTSEELYIIKEEDCIARQSM